GGSNIGVPAGIAPACHVGTTASSAGSASTATSVDASTAWRSDAGARRRSRIAASASASTSAPRATSKIGIVMGMSASCLLGLRDECCDPIELLRGQLRFRRLDERRHRVLDRAVEERLHQVRYCGPLRVAARDRRHIDVAWTVLLVAQMPALLEEPQE